MTAIKPAPSDVVERVARAICRANCRSDMSAEAVDCQVEHAWDLWTAEARAAIAAMPEIETLLATIEAQRDALEPFAAMARLLEKSLIFSGGKATDQSKVMVTNNECGLSVLTYGHFLDALAVFGREAKGWGGMYENPGIRAGLAPAQAKGEG